MRPTFKKLEVEGYRHIGATGGRERRGRRAGAEGRGLASAPRPGRHRSGGAGRPGFAGAHRAGFYRGRGIAPPGDGCLFLVSRVSRHASSSLPDGAGLELQAASNPLHRRATDRFIPAEDQAAQLPRDRLPRVPPSRGERRVRRVLRSRGAPPEVGRRIARRGAHTQCGDRGQGRRAARGAGEARRGQASGERRGRGGADSCRAAHSGAGHSCSGRYADHRGRARRACRHEARCGRRRASRRRETGHR